MTKDRTTNWKIAVVVLIVLTAIIAFAGGYVYTEYRRIKTVKLEKEAEERRLRADRDAKEAELVVYKDSVSVLLDTVDYLEGSVNKFQAFSDSILKEYENLVAEVEAYDYEEQVRLFNRQTGMGTPATLVEHSNDTIVMAPIPRIKQANISMVREELLEKRVAVQDSVIHYQREQIRVMQSISATQVLALEEKREIIDIQDRRIANYEELIEELGRGDIRRRWRATAIGTGVGIIIGLIL